MEEVRTENYERIYMNTEKAKEKTIDLIKAMREVKKNKKFYQNHVTQ